jgi:beta-carotene ketolase (CrtO type)
VVDPSPGDGSSRAEVVVIGGGHNGLVCAAYLARAGVDVLVLERNERCGGALFSTTTNGFTLEHGAVDHSTIIGSTIPEELELERHGLDYAYRTASALHVYGDGVQIAIGETAEDTARSIARVDAADAEAWLELVALSGRLLALTGELTRDPPVPMEPAQRLGSMALGRAGRPVLELARSSAVEVAERWFRSPHMRALAVFRSQFSGLPPWYPGTGAVFCLTPAAHGRRFGRPRGGSRAFVDALQSAVVDLGGRVRCDFPVTRVSRVSRESRVGHDRDGGGWRIESSSSSRCDAVIATRAVVSAIPPQDTVLRLIDPEEVPAGVRRRFERVEVVSGNLSQFTLAAALRDRPPVGHLEPGFEGSQLWLLPEPACALQNAAAALAGTLAARPGVLLTFPSLLDPSAAPDGAATAWINGFVAHCLFPEMIDEMIDDGGWARGGRGAQVASERVWATVESCLPGVHELVTDSVFTSADDLTRRTGAVNAGAHVSTIITQLLAGRPARGSADHRSGIEGVYLTGAGTNPGPSISGLPGRACAEAVLADLADLAASAGWGRVRRPAAAARRELARWRRLAELTLAARRDAGRDAERGAGRDLDQAAAGRLSRQRAD